MKNYDDENTPFCLIKVEPSVETTPAKLELHVTMKGLKKGETIKFQKVPVELLYNMSFQKPKGNNCWRATLAVFPARIRKSKVSVYKLAELHVQLVLCMHVLLC